MCQLKKFLGGFAMFVVLAFVDTDALLVRPDFLQCEISEVLRTEQYWVATCLAWRPANLFQTSPFFMLRTGVVDWRSGPGFEPQPYGQSWRRYVEHLSPFEPWSSAEGFENDTGLTKIKAMVPPSKIFFFPIETYWDRYLGKSSISPGAHRYAILHKNYPGMPQVAKVGEASTVRQQLKRLWTIHPRVRRRLARTISKPWLT